MFNQNPNNGIIIPEGVTYLMDRMVEIVRKHVIDPLTYLEDYDFINEGDIFLD